MSNFCRSALVSLLRSVFISKKHRTNTCLTVEEVKFLGETGWIRGAYQYAKDKRAEGEDKRYFWATAGSMYQQGLRAAFFVKRAAKVQHRGYVNLEGFKTFA